MINPGQLGFLPTSLNDAASDSLYPTPIDLEAYPDDQTEDIDLVHLEIVAGMPNEAPRLLDMKINEDYYELRNLHYIDKREAESDIDYVNRPKRTSGMTRQVVEKLTEHLYNPGPARRLVDAAAADAFLQLVYKTTSFDATMQSVDRLCTLNDAAAVQVAPSGRPACPITLHVWGGQEFAVWTSAEQPTRPWAVCTISKFNMRIRYQLWTATEFRTYYTKPMQVDQTSGGRVAQFEPSESGSNPYGVLPFMFVHNHMPTSDFWGGGIGTSIREANAEIDRELSDLAQLIQKYAGPTGFFRNVSESQRITTRPGAFNHLTAKGRHKDDALGQPEAFYVQPQLDIAGIWHDIETFGTTKLQETGVPMSAVRMDQQASMSGIAIVAEQLPLLTRAKKRQVHFSHHEGQLAQLILVVAGQWYRMPELVEAAHTVKEKIELLWPEPAMPLPTPERDQADEFELTQGLTSRTQVLMRRRGLTRPQAQAQLAQICEDLKYEAATLAPFIAPTDVHASASGEPPAVRRSRGGAWPPKQARSLNLPSTQLLIQKCRYNTPEAVLWPKKRRS